MRILVDSSVWIDLFAGAHTLQTAIGRRLLVRGEDVVVGDLVLAEVLQGTRSDQRFDRTREFMARFETIAIADARAAIEAARHYRRLRALGITIRKTIDTLIATRCILDGLPLLYSDRDFDPFVQHCGLRSAMDLDPGAT